MIIGRITIIKCENKMCKEIIYDGGIGFDVLTKTELNNNAKINARRENWIITRDGKTYCPECAKKLKLRNSNKK